MTTQRLSVADWSRASREPPFSVAALEGATDARFVDAWRAVAEESLARETPTLRWVSDSTLVAAAPAAHADELVRGAEREAQKRGARLRAPIYPARDGQPLAWREYRRWFPLADAIDDGLLTTSAHCNVALAARAAVSALPPEAAYAYDDAESRLDLRLGDRVLELALEPLVLVGLMRGLAPERSLAATLDRAVVCLRRTERLLAGADDVRFLDGLPVLRLGDELVVDPLAAELLRTGEMPPGRDEALVRAAGGGFTTPCTCAEERRVARRLRPRAEIYSFASGERRDDPLYVPFGERHCVIYELECPHAGSRPSAAEWAAAGWTLEGCAAASEGRVLESEVAVARTSGWMSTAAVAHAPEIGAAVTSPSSLATLARRLGFAAGARLTVYVPSANVLFFTDESFDDEPALRRALDEGILTDRLAAEALPLGPEVGYLAPILVGDEPVAPLRLRELSLTPQRPGSPV